MAEEAVVEESTVTIGTATMKEDGTILLQLRAQTDDGGIGDSLLIYPASHPNYHMITDHLPDLKAGSSVLVPPFPEKTGDDKVGDEKAESK